MSKLVNIRLRGLKTHYVSSDAFEADIISTIGSSIVDIINTNCANSNIENYTKTYEEDATYYFIIFNQEWKDVETYNLYSDSLQTELLKLNSNVNIELV